MSGWGGRRAQAWTRAVLANSDGRCVLALPGCTIVATTGDHIIPRHVAPDLRYVVENGQPACASCNSTRQDRDLATLQAEAAAMTVDTRSFFEDTPPGSPAPSFRFLPGSPTKTAV